MADTPRALIQPTRSPDYDMRSATGFILRGLARDTFLLEPFIDLPPIRKMRVNENTGEEAVVIERRFIEGFILSRDELRALGKRLIEAADSGETPNPEITG